MDIRDALHEFLLSCQADNLSPKTVTWYREMLNSGPYNVIDWLLRKNRVDLESVTVSDLREYIVWLREQKHARTGKPRSAYTNNAVVRCLHKFFRFCAEEYGVANPMQRIKYPKNPDPEPRAIKLETALELILSCGDDIFGIRNRAMLMFFLSTGARREGVATLTVERLHLQERYAVVTEKGRKTRVVPFDELTADALNEWMKAREPEQALFYNIRTRQPLTGDGVRTIIRRLALKNNITERHNPHGWRHLFAELYHQAGGQIASLSKLLGHKNTNITATIYLNFAMQTALDDYQEHNPMSRVADELKNLSHSKTSGSGL